MVKEKLQAILSQEWMSMAVIDLLHDLLLFDVQADLRLSLSAWNAGDING